MPSAIQLTVSCLDGDGSLKLSPKNDRGHERKTEPPRWGVQKNQQ